MAWTIPSVALTILLATTVLISTALLPFVAKISGRRKERRPSGIIVVSNPENPKFEIVAVHGLGAHPVHTWCSTSNSAQKESGNMASSEPAQVTFDAPAKSVNTCNNGHVHLLRDLLQPKFPEARILSFAHNSDWFVNAPVKTAQEIGDKLLEQLAEARKDNLRIPIIFVCHSFGGIIVKKALCRAGGDSEEILSNTHGIIFLGTPHQGSSASVAGAILATITAVLGSENGLLLSLRNHRDELSDLEKLFADRMREKEQLREKTQIFSFYETMPTTLMGWLYLGLVVTRDSARTHDATAIPIDTDHSGLNKPEDELSRKLIRVIEGLNENAKPTLNANQQYVVDKFTLVEGAVFDSYDEEYPETCLDGTRVDLLHLIDQWADNPEGKYIFWLQGMAGTGKSTISRTVARKFANSARLGASFFFKRGRRDRDKASRLFPTLVRQLVLQIPGLDGLVAQAIKANQDISTKGLGEQFKTLIREPLQKVKSTPKQHSTLIIVVDALDECENERDMRTIIELWSRLPHMPTIKLRLLLTSRPELPILQEFKRISAEVHQDMVLQDIVPRTTIQHDITIFLKDAFSKISENYNNDTPPESRLEHDWPGDKVIQLLTEMSIPLFIVAATICRFVGDNRWWNPRARLEKFLEMKSIGTMSPIGQTYLPVLQQLSAEVSWSRDAELLYEEFRVIIGSIVVLAEPLSIASLTDLLKDSHYDFSQQGIWQRLRPLHSVLRVPDDFFGPVRTLHLSFSEFLLSDEIRHEPFRVDGPATHRMLLMKCLQLLSGSNGLRENLCDLEYPGQLRQEVDRATVNKCLSPALQYACRYWVYHVRHGMDRTHKDEVHDKVYKFLRQYFLYWLEALSLMDRIAEVIEYVSDLQSLISVSNL
ncbi:uncharacterized protein PV07_08615 [Cladophialophora immunda]|uniref:NACHT domain-containing protein n=1 Tax=Cladophialophora immunda TaxID=569365 RepID=A0A0D2AKF4_9EURO|nr:uncharacterized protein PV07_08615 [Cladophialophora immunda]KIW25442.1 hypothetical protein PV07_08615 [Cladophialophora immunda]